MRKYANNHRRELIFQEGDWVFLKLQPYRMRSLARKPNEKLSPRFYGPYKVIQKIGEVAYRLELPEGKQDTSGFPCIFAQKGSSTHLFPSAITYNHEWGLGVASLARESNAEQEFNRWQKGGPHQVTRFTPSWRQLRTCWGNTNVFPQFDLEDKVNLEKKGGGGYW